MSSRYLSLLGRKIIGARFYAWNKTRFSSTLFGDIHMNETKPCQGFRITGLWGKHRGYGPTRWHQSNRFLVRYCAVVLCLMPSHQLVGFNSEKQRGCERRHAPSSRHPVFDASRRFGGDKRRFAYSATVQSLKYGLNRVWHLLSVMKVNVEHDTHTLFFRGWFYATDFVAHATLYSRKRADVRSMNTKQGSPGSWRNRSFSKGSTNVNFPFFVDFLASQCALSCQTTPLSPISSPRFLHKVIWQLRTRCDGRKSTKNVKSTFVLGGKHGVGNVALIWEAWTIASRAESKSGILLHWRSQSWL